MAQFLKIFSGALILLLIAVQTRLDAQVWSSQIYWPIGDINLAFNNVSGQFGARTESVTNWFHTGFDLCLTGTYRNPYLQNVSNPAQFNTIIRRKGGSGGEQWIRLEALDNHQIKQIVFFHIDNTNVVEGTQLAGGQNIPNSTVHPNPIPYSPHLHMEVYDEIFTEPLLLRNIATKNPLGWLYYVDQQNFAQGCGTNRYLYQFGSDGDGTFFELETIEHHDCIDFNRVELLFDGGNFTYSGSNVIDLNRRESALLDDLGVATANGYNNRYYQGNKIIAAPWTAACANQPVKDCKYRIYYTGTPSFFAMNIYDAVGNKISGVNRSPVPPCTDCPAPPNGPAPPPSLTAQTQSGGVFLTWPPAPSSSTTVKLYRRDYSSSSIRVASEIKYQTNYLVNTFLDPLINPKFYTRPGARYYYSAATVFKNVEGCNGPYVNPSCVPVVGQPCYLTCPVNERLGEMPGLAFPTSGLIFKYQGTTMMSVTETGTVAIRGYENAVGHSGFIFNKGGANVLSLAPNGDFSNPGGFSNSSPGVVGFTLSKNGNSHTITDYSKWVTSGSGVLQQKSF